MRRISAASSTALGARSEMSISPAHSLGGAEDGRTLGTDRVEDGADVV